MQRSANKAAEPNEESQSSERGLLLKPWLFEWIFFLGGSWGFVFNV